MITYHDLKAQAKAQGLPVKALIALAPQNDPYYTGTPTDEAMATWFANVWERFSFRTGTHLRRIHYLLVSQDPPFSRANGLPYLNDHPSWNYLLQASKVARYLGRIPAADFEDHRNPDPHLIRYYPSEPYEPKLSIEGQWDFELYFPSFPDLPTIDLNHFDCQQPYHLEIWTEKSTMNDILLPACKRWEANLITAKGELSITAARDLINRVIEADRPARIFYISDFDPAGRGMPLAIARKLEFFTATLAPDLDIILDPLALTYEQCVEYHLPRSPIKHTERRRHRFQEEFGQGATELDALEALHPGELGHLLDRTLGHYYDEDLDRRTRQERRQLLKDLATTQDDAITHLVDDYNDLASQYQDALADFQEATGPITERLDPLRQAITAALQEAAGRFDLDDYPIPKGRRASDDPDCLYDSSRSYFDQLARYKQHQKPSTNGT